MSFIANRDGGCGVKAQGLGRGAVMNRVRHELIPPPSNFRQLMLFSDDFQLSSASTVTPHTAHFVLQRLAMPLFYCRSSRISMSSHKAGPS